MDGLAFDRLVRAIASAKTRRHLLAQLTGLPLLGTLAALLAPDAEARRTPHRHHRQAHAHHTHERATVQRKRKHKKHKRGRCTPEPVTQTCAGRCGSVSNNCGTAVDCGACACTPLCPPCQTCDGATAQCVAVANATPCNDGNLCTTGDTCQGGLCVAGTPVVCTALDQCHVAGTCTPATGLCSHPAKPNGTACNDGNACTQTDTCQGGVCVGTNPVVCVTPPLCHVLSGATCNPATGTCLYPNATNGTICGTSTHGGTTLRCCDGTCPDPTCVPSGPVTGVACGSASCAAVTDNCCAQLGGVCSIPGPCRCLFAETTGDGCGSDLDCAQAGVASACICGTCQVPPL